jgi:hypothetical protein
MLFWALLASGQINMRKVDGWHTLSTKLIDQPIGRCPAYLLNIAKRSLPELILSGVGLASNDAVG